jgi:hypothetical protein
MLRDQVRKLKKVISLTLVLVMMLTCIGLVACSKEKKGRTSPPPSGNGAQSTLEGFTWDDVPIYPGATTDKGRWFSEIHDDVLVPVISESRSYETNDNLKAVADFYKAEMPKNGWDQLGWTQEGKGTEVGEFTKKDDQGYMSVRLKDLEDEVLIFLHRSSMDLKRGNPLIKEDEVDNITE